MNQKKNRLLTRGLILTLTVLFFCLTFGGCSSIHTADLPLTENSPQVTADTGSQTTTNSPTQETSVEIPEDSSFEVHMHFIDVGQAIFCVSLEIT